MTRKPFTLVFGALWTLLHPDCENNPQKGIQYAARYYDLHDNMFKAKAVKKKVKPGEKVTWYKQLQDENPRWHDWFVEIRKAFNYGADREKAAEQFLLICRNDKPSNNDFKHMRYAAEETNKERPFIDHTAIHFNQWLKTRVFDGYEAKSEKVIIEDKKADKRRELIADLNHFKGQLKHSPGNKFIEDEIKRVQGLIEAL